MIEIRNHPAQARDENNWPAFDDKGNPLPLFPAWKAVYVDGYLKAYVNEKQQVIYLYQDPDLDKEEIELAVKKSTKKKKNVKQKRVSKTDTPENQDDSD